MGGKEIWRSPSRTGDAIRKNHGEQFGFINLFFLKPKINLWTLAKYMKHYEMHLTQKHIFLKAQTGWFLLHYRLCPGLRYSFLSVENNRYGSSWRSTSAEKGWETWWQSMQDSLLLSEKKKLLHLILGQKDLGCISQTIRLTSCVQILPSMGSIFESPQQYVIFCCL